MKKLDFRSDTVTKPSQGMLDAMASAEVGDDVFGDDPTVNLLEAKTAEMFGKEAGLFCPSGTMTNQIAINVHTRPGDEVMCDKTAHIYHYEGGGVASNSGCSVKLLDGVQGQFSAADVLGGINPDDPHFPVSKLVSIENTSNKGGGTIWKLKEIQSIASVCQQHNLGLHLDGARLFNALVEIDDEPKDVLAPFDSASLCLSKGLGCPVGSVLLGTESFIKRGRRIRKVFGGGMRQAGILAAAGLYALEHNIDRLKIDHLHAKRVREILLDQSWVQEVDYPQTNIVIAEVADSIDVQKCLAKLEENGILAVPFGSGKIRFVTHLDITGTDIDSLETRIKKVSI